jgi:hypothetical protein
MARALTYGEGLAAPEVMDANQLMAQAEALVDQLVCYRAYPNNTPAEGWRRYAGILKRQGHGFIIAQDPSFNYLPLTVPVNVPSEVPFPAPGYTYTRIVRATVWVAEHAKNLEQHICQLTANAGPPGAQQVAPALQALIDELHDEDGVPLPPPSTSSMIENDAVAFDPAQWGWSDPSAAARLESHLRMKFAAASANPRHTHQIQDALRTIFHLVSLVPFFPGLPASPGFQQAARVQLKRLLIADKSHQGHNTQYISQFAACVENACMPTWVQ